MASEEASRGYGYQNHVGHIPYDILGNNGPGMIFVFFVLVSMLVVTVCWCVIKCYVLAEMETSSTEDYKRYRKIRDVKGKLSTTSSDQPDDEINCDVIGTTSSVVRDCEITITESLPPPSQIVSSPAFNSYSFPTNHIRETCLHDYAQHDDYLREHPTQDSFQVHSFRADSFPSLAVPNFSSTYHFTPV